MSLKKLILSAAALIFLNCHLSFGQTEQVWGQFSIIYTASPKWKLSTDAFGRYQLAKNGWKGHVLREVASFNIRPKLNLVGGAGYYSVDYPDIEDYKEFRIWQGVQARWPKIGPWEFTHYVRLEEKFIFQGLEYPYVTRFRYMIGGGMPLLKWDDGNRVLSVNLGFEPLWLLNSKVSDLYSYTHRSYYGLGLRLNDKWSFGLSYISQEFKTGKEEHFFHISDVAFLKVAYNLKRQY